MVKENHDVSFQSLSLTPRIGTTNLDRYFHGKDISDTKGAPMTTQVHKTIVDDDHPKNHVDQRLKSKWIQHSTKIISVSATDSPSVPISYAIEGQGEIYRRLNASLLNRDVAPRVALNTPLLEFLDPRSLMEAVCVCKYWYVLCVNVNLSFSCFFSFNVVFFF